MMADRPGTLEPLRGGARALEAVPLDAEQMELVADIAAAIDRRLGTLGVEVARGPGHNVSFVIDCRQRLKERK
jgi:hypothetical protein